MKTKPLSFLILFVLTSFIQGNCAFSEIVPGDLTGDFKVNIDDLSKFATVWLNDRGLVGYWKFDGNELDSSQYGHYSLTKGTYFWSEEGYFDGALQLTTANGSVRTPHCFGISGTEPRTCAAWIKTSAIKNDIIGWGDKDLPGQRWLLMTNARLLRVAVKNGKIVGSTDVCDGAWHHVAAVFEDDGTPNVSDVKLYVDGVEEVTTYVSRNIYTAYSNNFRIGSFSGNPFSGLIDEVRIYNTALSAEQIASISTGCAGAGCSAGTDSLFDITSLSEISQHWIEEKGPVVISEFMAENDDTLEDEDGDDSDWIEIHNPTNSTVSLDGWYLTDNSGSLRKWSFPDGMDIASDEYKVIFASGKDRRDPNYLHTNFKLDNKGEYLALVKPDGGAGNIAVAHAYDPNFPKQNGDISYGIWLNEESYFPVASPGTANLCGMSGYRGVSEKPAFSHTGGIITSPFSLELSTTSPSAQIHYTLDNSTPFGTSDIYSGPIPINITSTTIVRAQAIEPGKVPSKRVINIYIPVTTTVANFSSNIPVVIVDTAGYDIDSENNPSVYYPYRPVGAIFIDTDDTGRAAVNGEIDFIGRAGIRVRGNSSASDWNLTNWPKKQYSFETWGDLDDEDKNVSILGFPSESDWILHAPYSDKTLMRNVLAYKWSNDIGQYASRTKFFELFLNTDGGNVSMSDYWGVYILMEKIKRDDDRVDIAKLEPDHDAEPEITGGYIIKRDRLDPGDTGFSTSLGTMCYVEPEEDEITPAQAAWIQGYISEFESVLYSGSFANPVNGYAKYIDVDSFIDHHILTELLKNVDGYRFSTYMYKDRGEKLKIGPLWDFNLSLGNAYGWYFRLEYAQANSWYYPWIFPEHKWYDRLMNDPEYLLRYADRWFECREDKFSDTKLLSDIDYYFNLLNAESAGRNFSQWNILGEYIWPNYYYWASSYQQEIDWIKTWLAGYGSSPGDFSDHLDFFDNNVGFDAPPSFYVSGVRQDSGGKVDPGSRVTMSAPTGTIYYTTDGSDPRLSGGGISPSAAAYVEGLDTQFTVFNMGSTWSYLDDGSDQNIIWKQFAYNDNGWNSGPARLGYGNDGEVTTVDYGGNSNNKYITTYFRHTFSLTDASEITAVTVDLIRDDGAVIYLNGQELGRSNMPTGQIDYLTPASDFVSGSNETTVFSVPADASASSWLYDGDNVIAVEVHQNSPTSSDLGFDMRLNATRTVGGTIIILNDNTTVKARILDGGNWSALNEARFTMNLKLFINEFMADNHAFIEDPDEAGEYPDWLELYNASANSIDLGVMYLTDDLDAKTKYDIPGGVSIEPDQHLIFWADDDSGQGSMHTNFKLGKSGEEIAIVDSSGEDVVDSKVFGLQETDKSYGRSPDGGDDWGVHLTPTPGDVNTAHVP